MNRSLFKPRYWPTWLLLGVLWLLCQLPYRWQLALGPWLGRLMQRLDKPSAHATRVNLELCFPSLSAAAREQLARDSFASLGCALLESAMAWWASDARLHDLAHFHGLEHLQQALASGQGAIFLSAHQTGLEIAGRLISMQVPFSVSYRPQKNPVLDYVAGKVRQRYYQRTIARDDIRSMFKTLKQGQAVFYAADTDVRDSGCFAPFFGIPASTTTATSRYAKRTGAKVLPIFFYRRTDGRGYDITIQAPLADFPSDDLMQDTTRINTLVEQAIRVQPAQYLWQYRRFKFRPEGQTCFYAQAQQTTKQTLSVIIICQNEAHDIRACLESVKFADEIIVVDSGSTDDTLTICREYTDQVYSTDDWPGYGKQKNRALAKASGDWVLSIDADERVSASLATEIQTCLQNQQSVAAFYLPIITSLCGQYIRHGHWANRYVLRLFKRELARFDDAPVHEALCVQGPTAKLKQTLIHHSYRDLHEVIEKIDRYSSARAQVKFQQGQRATLFTAITHGVWAFLRGYLLKAGFLDGRAGFIVAMMSAQSSYYAYLKLIFLNQRTVE